MVVLRALYSWLCKTNNNKKIVEIILKHKLLRCYNNGYCCCVSKTSCAVCSASPHSFLISLSLCQPPLLPHFPFPRATSLSSPFLLQIFAFRIYLFSSSTLSHSAAAHHLSSCSTAFLNSTMLFKLLHSGPLSKCSVNP